MAERFMRELPEKAILREEILADRRAIPPEVRAQSDAALIAALLPAVSGTVCAYRPMAREPGGAGLLPALTARAGRLLLPVRLADNDLDWELSGGDRCGVEAITSADFVVVPALAVDETGMRLGRGGGSYDRALARVRPAVPVVALLYDGELLPALPAEPHDRRVTAAITPAGGWWSLSRLTR